MITAEQRRELDRLARAMTLSCADFGRALAYGVGDVAASEAAYVAAIQAWDRHLDSLTDWSTAPVRVGQDGTDGTLVASCEDCGEAMTRPVDGVWTHAGGLILCGAKCAKIRADRTPSTT